MEFNYLIVQFHWNVISDQITARPVELFRTVKIMIVKKIQMSHYYKKCNDKYTEI